METTRIKWDKSMVTRCFMKLPRESYVSAGMPIVEQSKEQPVFEPAEADVKNENIAEELPDFPVIFDNDVTEDWNDFKVAVHIAAM